METSREKTGVIYCRVSSKEQVSNTSLETQERSCREYAQREGITVLASFVEEGESAKTANRTEFNKALAFCSEKKNKVGYFIVYKIDRFMREQDEHGIVRAFLKKLGTKLRSVTEQIDETPVGRAMEGMLSVFAEFDNNVRSARSRSGMLERIKKGVWVWQAPLGYKRIVQGGNLVHDENFAPYIRLAFEEYSKGTHSFQSLADFMYTRGFRTRTGKKAFAQLMQATIRNPIYCGQIKVWDMEVVGAFEPIVTEELFLQCQPTLRKFGNGKKREASNPNFPLRRFTKCGVCNVGLTGSFSTGRKGIKYPYYHHPKQGCSLAVSIPKETLEQNFVEYLQDVGPNSKYEKVFREVVLDVWQKNYKALDADNVRTRREIESLETERQKIFDLHRAGTYSAEEFLEQKDRINILIQHKKNILDDKRVEEFNMETALNFCFGMTRDGGKTWVELEELPQMRARFQQSVFPQKVSFDGEKFETTKMSLIYELNKESAAKKSDLVRPVGFEPTTVSLKGSCSTN